MRSLPNRPRLLRPLARRQVIELSEDRWDHDLARLERVLEGAGVQRSPVAGLSPRSVTLLGVLSAALVLGPIAYRESSSLATDRYTGLWYLPGW